jgi:uncharacterized protein HemY
MDKIKLLNEVNNLVAVGLKKTAIDLIEEYLEKVPAEPAILRSLGRIYFLDKKPDQAVKYLQLSLKNLVSRKFCLLIKEGTQPSPPNLMATIKYLTIVKN